MTAEDIMKELAEEVRSNSKLRHRMGMEEGSPSGLLDGGREMHLMTKDGEEFFIVAVPASDGEALASVGE